jgi:kumamolisin
MKPMLESLHTVEGATLIGRAAQDQKLNVTVKVKHNSNFSVYKAVLDWLHKSNILTGSANQTTETIQFTGRVHEVEKTFGVALSNYHRDTHVLRHHDTPLQLPDELADHVTAVLGVSDTFRARPHFRKLAQNATAAQKTYYPEQLAAYYNFPKADGTGQVAGIVELGGGYNVNAVNEYAMSRNLPIPTIVNVNVGSGSNTPGSDADGEVCLDLEIVASIAPKAKIVMFFADNTDQGFSNAIAQAVAYPGIGAISISWGSPESNYSRQAIQAFEQDLAKAVAKGINVYVSSGDSGSSDGVKGNNVDYPGSSPNAVCCGGTEIEANGTEVVWNDGNQGGATGGGISAVFPKPSYQANLSAEVVDDGKRPKPPVPRGNMRNTPDVAGDASPNSGIVISVNGSEEPIGGTSAISPLYCALNLLLNQALGHNVGWINPLFYKHHQAFNDVTQGNNGSYAAKAGFDNCTGLGTPNGTKLLQALKA